MSERPRSPSRARLVLSALAARRWAQVHKWTSIVCTAFLLITCLTGLPLIFRDEIQHALGEDVETTALPEGTPRASLDRIVEAARVRRPNEFVRYVFWDPDDPDVLFVTMVTAKDVPRDADHLVAVDARTAIVLAEPNRRAGVMHFFAKLHEELFAGLPGKLLIGFMGLVFVAAVVSGVVLYGPFTQRLDFGTVRKGKTPRMRWLDLHNLLGIVTVTWAAVVGVTGAINACADLALARWQQDQLASMVASYKGLPEPATLTSVERALQTARAAAPGMKPGFVAYPGSPFSSTHHYAAFMRGSTPVTSRIIKPVLIDAESAELTDTRDLPWYVTSVLVSQPLHFGDYGGLPLKIIWALLDLLTIVVLGSGIYLWLAPRGEKSAAS